jgi:hypothetical protein
MYIVTPSVLGLRGPCDHGNDCGYRSVRQLINQSALSVTIDGITPSDKASFSGCASILMSVPNRVFF